MISLISFINCLIVILILDIKFQEILTLYKLTAQGFFYNNVWSIPGNFDLSHREGKCNMTHVSPKGHTYTISCIVV